ncbi:MAG: hypothetical protein JOZ78_01945 [Chroococcidiopsidaceae cyanobacterium CP_BM_ER_R8_30]|nr:hypothetical protein [Chroococcidiopsidaceae cyanobacterium CP_BM_ER_R8_30]
MEALEFLHLYATAGQSSDQPSPNEVQQVRGSSVQTNLPFGTMPDGLLFLIPICLILIKAILVSAIASICLATRAKPRQRKRRLPPSRLADEKRLVNTNHYQQAPCRNCQFFANNPQLKYAVHPSTVLTKYASNCSDYLPRTRPDSSLPAPHVVSATVFDPQTQSWYRISNLYQRSELVWAVAPFLRHRSAIQSSTLVGNTKSQVPSTVAAQVKDNSPNLVDFQVSNRTSINHLRD